jgi:hypothetical protein
MLHQFVIYFTELVERYNKFIVLQGNNVEELYVAHSYFYYSR